MPLVFRAGLVLLGGIAAVTALPAQRSPTAAEVTAPGRTLRRPLNLFLSPIGDAKAAARNLVLVLDPTSSVAKAGFAKEFALAVAEVAKDLVDAKLGLHVVGQPAASVLPTAEHQRIVDAVDRVLQRPSDHPQNLFAALREVATGAKKGDEATRLLLVSFDNGEAEDEVEHTGRLLQRQHISLDVLTVEACLADSYWVLGREHRCVNLTRNRQAATGARLVGGDAPLIDVPFGFLLQLHEGNLVAPAGYAPWALSRLAHLSGGHVSLFASDANYQHHCILYGDCPDCSFRYRWPDLVPEQARHGNHTEDYLPERLAQLAPPVVSRAEAVDLLAKDPLASATQVAWRRGYEAGLILGLPTLQLRGGKASVEPGPEGGPSLEVEGQLRPDIGASLRDLSRAADLAHRLAGDAERIERDLAQAIGSKPSALRREAAIARYTQCMLLLTRVALLEYERFLRLEAPEQLRRDQAEGRAGSVDQTERSICHGMASYLRALTKPSALRAEMARLAKLLDAFERDYGGSPISFALRRMSFPKFMFFYPGVSEGADPQPRLPSGEKGGPTTPRGPVRPGSRMRSGPTTGGPTKR